MLIGLAALVPSTATWTAYDTFFGDAACMLLPLVLAGGLRVGAEAAPRRLRDGAAGRSPPRLSSCARRARHRRRRDRRLGRARRPGALALAVRVAAGDGARPSRSGGRRRLARGRRRRARPDRSDRFAIGFDERDRARLHALWDEVIDSQRWSEGPLTEALRGRVVGAGTGSDAVAFGGLDGRGAGRARVRRRARARPCCARRTRSWPRRSRRCTRAPASRSSTATATTSACRSPTSRRRSRATGRARRSSSTSAATSRSRSSGSPRSAAREGIFLIEDCAHAHGAGVARPPARHLGRRRRVVVLRDEDDLDRRGRHARLAPPRAARVTRARSATTASPTTPSRA